MPIKITNILNLQRIEAVVSGPDGANRLFVITGIIPTNLFTSATIKETFTFLIGPTLTRRQFVRAITMASLNSIQFSGGAPTDSKWSVESVDADWDDESGQVEVRVEVLAISQGGLSSAGVISIGFQATILAEMES
jgi:hypothetical protein